MDRQKYMDLINPALILVIKKHKDYQSEGIEVTDYFPFGHRSYVQMLHVKTKRLVSLVKDDKIPTNESILDTVRDLINYGVFYLDYLENGDGRKQL